VRPEPVQERERPAAARRRRVACGEHPDHERDQDREDNDMASSSPVVARLGYRRRPEGGRKVTRCCVCILHENAVEYQQNYERLLRLARRLEWLCRLWLRQAEEL
jgi:hypothetical protein